MASPVFTGPFTSAKITALLDRSRRWNTRFRDQNPILRKAKNRQSRWGRVPIGLLNPRVTDCCRTHAARRCERETAPVAECKRGFRCPFPVETDPPNQPPAVIGNKQRTVPANENCHGAAPSASRAARVYDPTSNEILHWSGRDSHRRMGRSQRGSRTGMSDSTIRGGQRKPRCGNAPETGLIRKRPCPERQNGR